MENRITYQRLSYTLEDRYMIAQRYYGVLSIMNGLGLTEREIQVVAYAAIRGNMSYANIRGEFCERYKTSSATINNMISRLKRLSVFIKDNGKVKVNPRIVISFNDDVVLQIVMKHGD
jgi:hypothetical protein